MDSEGNVAEEIAGLLDQCSPDELTNILQAIENGDLATPVEQEQLLDVEISSLSPGTPAAAPASSLTAPPLDVLPPAGPPPVGTGRRPVPVGVRRSGHGDMGEEQQMTLSEAKKLLDDHSSAVVTEVRKILPYMVKPTGGETIDLETLTKVLAARDDEVKELETRLCSIQDELSAKDRRVADLGGELDLAIREIRHRQLDLEFQQLKLDETVRNNAEMEQVQKSLVARVEEAGQNARHAALDSDMGRPMMGGLIHVQGSLPWTMRKGRPAPTSGFA